MSQRILVRLNVGHLLIANTGKAFSKEGFRAICYTDTSSKRADDYTSAQSVAEAKQWIDDLRQEKRHIFSIPDQLRSAVGTATRTAGDYSGRLLLELLQNAIDADREQMIGYKGIGFRSVLNEAEVTEIHSGNLHARWSDGDARDSLRGLEAIPEQVPVLDLPVWHAPDDEIAAILQDEYQTIVRLRLTKEGQGHVQSEWSGLVGDPSLLLFIDGLIEVQWEHHDGSKLAWTRRDGDDDLVTILETGNSADSRERRWRCFKHETASAAYPVDHLNQLITSPAASPRLRCYFPAKKSPHPFLNLLLHNSKFGLQSNREVVVLDEDSLRDLAQAIFLAADSVQSEGDLLDLLQVTPFSASDNTLPETALWNAVKAVLVSAKLKGLSNRTIGEIRTCPLSDDLPYGWSKEERFKRWAAFLMALQQEGVTHLPVLSPGVENETREATLLMFNERCRYSADELKGETWAPVEGLDGAASSSKIPIFLPHGGKPLNPAAGIEVHFLRGSFIKAFEGFAGAKVESFLTDFLGVAPFSASAVIQQCVLKATCIGAEHPASPELIHFLKSLREADQKEFKKPVESFDWKDKARSQLIQKLHLRLQGLNWPVLQVYASQSWTGDDFLQSAYGDKRGYLDMDPPDQDEDKASWESFWRWLGVGWCPKVVPIIKNISLPQDAGGWNWNGNSFNGSRFCNDFDLPDWEAYCRDLEKEHHGDIFQRRPIMKANWAIDVGPKVLAYDKASQIISAHWQHYQPFLETEIRYSSRLQRPYNEDKKVDGMQSYLRWHLRVSDWLPCIDGRKYSGKTVFKRDGAVARAIPSFVPALDEELGPTSRAPKSFFLTCGIRGGWDEVRDDDWLQWLKDAEHRSGAEMGSKTEQDSIRNLYRVLLKERRLKTGPKWNEKETAPLEGVRLWMIERGQSNMETWHKPGLASSMYYLDRGELADLALPKLRLFPQRLDGLEAKALLHLGLPPLSKHLSGTPLDEGWLADEFSAAAMARVNELVALFCAGDASLEEGVLKTRLISVQMRRVDQLEVSFQLNGLPIGTPIKRQVFQQVNENGSWVAFVDRSSKRQWEVFAETLLLACELPMDKRKEVRDLLQCPIQELSDELIRLGVAPETAEALKQTHPAEPEPAPGPHQSKTDGKPPNIDSEHVSHPTIGEAQAVSTSSTSPTGGAIDPRGATDNAGRTQRQRQATRPHPESGMSAQKYLFVQIEKWCLEQGLPQPRWEQDYIDITIPVDPPIFIEAKSIEKRSVHWTENQIRTAQSGKGTYVVALLRSSGSQPGEYDVFWVTNPLEAFGNLSHRHIKWTWQDQDGENFALESWLPPEVRPQKAASSFQAVISLDDHWLDKLIRGVEKGLNAVGNLRQSDKTASAQPATFSEARNEDER